MASLGIRVILQVHASASKKTEQNPKADVAEIIHSQERSSNTFDEGKQTSHMPSSFLLEKSISQ